MDQTSESNSQAILSESTPSKEKRSCCGRIFKNKSNYNRHIRFQHLGNLEQMVIKGARKRFRCDKCIKVFTRPDNLRSHKSKFHPSKDFGILLEAMEQSEKSEA